MKWYCTVCGYVHEGDQPPEACPVCKQPASKFKLMEEDAEYATVHKLGEGKAEGVSEDIIKDLRANFEGECSEVGMYLAMARVADREGYPEIAEAFKRYAFEEADHASRFAELLGEVLTDSTEKNLKMRADAEAGACEGLTLQREQRRLTSTLFTTPSTKWLRTRQDTARALRDF